MVARFALPILLAILAADTSPGQGQGFVPRGRVYSYGVLSDSTIVTHSFAADFSDSTIYAGVDSFVVRRADVVGSAWSRSFQDSLVQWMRDSDPTDPSNNQIQLVGFSRPGLRVFYEPPLPWVASSNQLSTGDSTWTWFGRVWPEGGTPLPDSLAFSAGRMDTVEVFDGGTLLGWPIRVESAATIPLADGRRLDLGGRVIHPGRPGKTFESTTSWYGPYNDGEFHWLLLRDQQVAVLPQRATPRRPESMGSWRARYRAQE